MNKTRNFYSKGAIIKLKSLVEEINTCLFCTNVKTDNGASCRPMVALSVCDEGNLWFFSEKNSYKNKEISKNKNVQLFFLHPGLGSYLVINGEAEVVTEHSKIEELWSAIALKWFKGGKEDPNISLIKVFPSSAYYWDTDGNKMINFLKMITASVNKNEIVNTNEGVIKI